MVNVSLADLDAALLGGSDEFSQINPDQADIHKVRAVEMFNVPYNQVTKEQRRAAKMANYHLVYGENNVINHRSS